MMSAQLIFPILLLATMCSAHIGGGQITRQEVNPRIYCGRALARMIATICYDDTNIEKRSESGMFSSLMSPFDKEEEREVHLGWPWMSASKARSMGSIRGKRLVVNECCEKPCSINELLNYC